MEEFTTTKNSITFCNFADYVSITNLIEDMGAELLPWDGENYTLWTLNGVTVEGHGRSLYSSQAGVIRDIVQTLLYEEGYGNDSKEGSRRSTRCIRKTVRHERWMISKKS